MAPVAMHVAWGGTQGSIPLDLVCGWGEATEELSEGRHVGGTHVWGGFFSCGTKGLGSWPQWASSSTASVLELSWAEGPGGGPGQPGWIGQNAVPASLQVASRELVCRSCLKKTLHKLEGMMRVLQAETATGTGTPTGIADSILNITGAGGGPAGVREPQPPPVPPPRAPSIPSPAPAGDLIHLASVDVQGPQPSELGAEPSSLMVASRAYHLSSALMCILMRSRVLNEEPLTLAGEEIVAQGKRSDPLSLLCQGNSSVPGCHFSIPTAFSGALSNLSDVVQLMFLVDSNPFPFGYISNYTVSTKVASMAFQTQAGAQIPIGQLASERAITVKVPNSSDPAARGRRTPASSAVVQPQASVSVVVTPENSNPAAGLHLQLTYALLGGRCRGCGAGGCCLPPGPGLSGGRGGAPGEQEFPHAPPSSVDFSKVCASCFASCWGPGLGAVGDEGRAGAAPSTGFSRPLVPGSGEGSTGLLHVSPRVRERPGASVRPCPRATRALLARGARALPGRVLALSTPAQ